MLLMNMVCEEAIRLRGATKKKGYFGLLHEACERVIGLIESVLAEGGRNGPTQGGKLTAPTCTPKTDTDCV